MTATMKSVALFALIWLTPLGASAEVSEQLAYESYRVPHAPGRTLSASIKAVSPFRSEGSIFHAYTAWKINWRFQWQKDGDGLCRISSTTTNIKLTVTTPELISNDPEARRTFEAHKQKLLFHENGHVKISRDAAYTIDHAIQSMPPQPDCKQLGASANALGRQLMAEASARNRDYDRETSHGKTQGAWLK